MHLFFVGLFLFVVGVGPKDDGAHFHSKERMIVLLEGCDAACVCDASVTPTTHLQDVCAGLSIIDVVPSQDGCCADTPSCAGYPEGCVMGQITYVFQLVGGNRTCTSMDIATFGADEGQSETGLTVGQQSQDFTVGGFSYFCDDDPDGISASGSLKVTCTAGGVPVPRTMVHLEYSYACLPCAG